MAKRITIDQLGKTLNRTIDDLTITERTAEYRTINKIADRSRKMLANDVYQDTGISKATAKRRIVIYKASRNNLRAVLFMRDTRITYPSPRKIIGGVSFVGAGRKRKKVKREIGAGSKPFVVNLPAGGRAGASSNKKAAVYVRAGYTGKKSISKKKRGSAPHPRKITAMYFSSLPHVARKDWQEKVNAFSIEEFKKEYPEQLKKAKFKGRAR